LVDCLQIILFHLECRYEGTFLILGLFLDSIVASWLRKTHFVFNQGGFWSLCQVWLNVLSACQFLVLNSQF
jgi:hypothetical protein